MRTEVKATILESEHVRLEPLSLEHADALLYAGRDERVWAWRLNPLFTDIDGVKRWIQHANQLEMLGERVPFAIIDKDSQLPIGSISYLNIALSNYSIDIGFSWLAPKYWESSCDTESYLLLIKNAFESLEMVRVQFLIDSRNTKTQETVEAIGATKEGVLRCHRVIQNHARRDNIVYSILDTEWPLLKERYASAIDLMHTDTAK